MSAKNGKPCRNCGGNEWYKNGSCVACAKERSRRRQAANPDKHNGANRRYRAANREKGAEYSRRWQAANPGKGAERQGRYRAANPEKVRESIRHWYSANPEKAAEYHHRRRTRKTAAGGSFTAAEWKALVKHQNGRCLGCGKKEKLTADHIIPVEKGGSSNIDNIQGLCKPCNSRKGTKTTDYRPKDGGFIRWIQKKLFD